MTGADPANTANTATGVTIERVDTFVVDLPAKRQMVLAGGASAGGPGVTTRVLTRVTGSSGEVGWGESRGNHRWNEETLESVHSTLTGYLGPAVVGAPVWDLDGVHARMDAAIRSGATLAHPVAKAGIDVAVHDLLGKETGLPVSALLGGRRLEGVQLAWIVASNDLGHAQRQAEDGLARGYTAFKVKIGMHGVNGDIEFVSAVRRAVGPDALLWADANQGYRLLDALRVARGLAEQGVELFEQPLPAGDLTGLRRLVDRSPVPIGVDEGLRTAEDLVQLLSSSAVDTVVAKVQRSAGLWRSRQLCELAESAGLVLAASGLSETDIGLAAGLHLCSRFGITGTVDLNGREFLESPFVGRTVELDGGVARVPVAPGLGVDVDVETVLSLARPIPS